MKCLATISADEPIIGQADIRQQPPRGNKSTHFSGPLMDFSEREIVSNKKHKKIEGKEE